MAAVTACLVLPPEADRITAGDLATVETGLAALPPDTVFGYAPVAGARRLITATELGRFASRHGLAEWKPQAMCAERAMTPLDRERVLAAMRLSLPGVRIEIMELARHEVPRGELVFPPAGLGVPAARGVATWRGYVIYGGAHRFTTWARVRATVERTRVVAVETLAAGRPIQAHQVRLETVAEFPSDKGWVRTLGEVVGHVARRSARAGTALRGDLLAAPLDVLKGEVVRVEARFGGARLEIDARAEADGRVGDRIPLRNLESRRRFLARVEAKGRAVAAGSVQP